MKRGVINYSVTWQEDGSEHEEIYFSKFNAVARYMEIIMECNYYVSCLRIWEIYRSLNRPMADITDRVNRFLA